MQLKQELAIDEGQPDKYVCINSLLDNDLNKFLEVGNLMQDSFITYFNRKYSESRTLESGANLFKSIHAACIKVDFDFKNHWALSDGGNK